MDAMDSGNDSEHDLISTEMLENIRGGSQSHPNVNRREACYKIRGSIKKRLLERNGALKATQNMGKGLHKAFKTVIKNILQDLPSLGESGSELSHFILEPRNLYEVKKLSDDINKPLLKTSLKEMNNLIKNQISFVEYPEKGEPVTPCMDVYKANIQSDGSLDKIKL